MQIILVQDFSGVEKSGVENFMVGKSGVGKFMVEKSGVERSGVEVWC